MLNTWSMCSLLTHDMMQLNTCSLHEVHEMHMSVLLPFYNNKKKVWSSNRAAWNMSKCVLVLVHNNENKARLSAEQLETGRLCCFPQSHTTIQASTTVTAETCL